ncbi:MAG: six-hairpin glycosidase [Bacteroidales bacterium]|nr:six-hairpin glycosidase [Bacteroidales bacterium]
MKMKKIIFSVSLVIFTISHYGQDMLRYIGTQQSNINYPDGQLRHAIGVHNIQVMRANREHPEFSDGNGWTYNHGPNLAYWNGKFYLNYLSTPHSEHVQPGQTLLVTSDNGRDWSFPVVIFPQYDITVGTVKITSRNEKGFVSYPGMKSVMHQRMGFYVSKKNRLFTLGYYGISFGPTDFPNDGNGIGRVVREIYKDGTFGDIYFIRYNKGYSDKNTRYPFYTKSKDKGFVEACNELLANKLIVQQWREESDRDDPIFGITKDHLEGNPNDWPGGIGVHRAFNFYRLPDNRVVGLWKHALYTIGNPEGTSWTEARTAENIINGGAKIWGQRTSDGRYAIIYNPDKRERYPLAIMTSENGLDYDNLICVHGEVSPCRYRGVWKDYGPQYVRGIVEGNGTPPEGKMWVTYSMNKEDIWVSSISVPVRGIETSEISEVFSSIKDGEELNNWNIYSPVWAPVNIEKKPNGVKHLVIKDKDLYDYAKAERIFKPAKDINIHTTLTPMQTDGELYIELQNMNGEIAVTLIFNNLGEVVVNNLQAYEKIYKYNAGEECSISITTHSDGKYDISFNTIEKKGLRLASSHVGEIERIVYRTGPGFGKPKPDPDLWEDKMQISPRTIDLPYASEMQKENVFLIKDFKAISK